MTSVFKNPVVNHYRKIIVSELQSYALQFQPIIKEILEEKVNIEGYKGVFNVPEANNFYELINIKTGEAELKQKIIYLTTLLEAFMKDYIANENGVDNFTKNLQKPIDDFLKAHSYYRFPDGKESLLHMEYSVILLDKYYNKNIHSKVGNGISPLFLELGRMRNLLVHHNGNLDKVPSTRLAYFQNGLQQHIRNGNLKDNKAQLSYELIDLYIESAIRFVIVAD